METFSRSLALCEGNPSVTSGFPSQRPVMRRFDVFFGLCLNKQLSKQSRRRWFETSSHSLWRHCNVKIKSWLIRNSSYYYEKYFHNHAKHHTKGAHLWRMLKPMPCRRQAIIWTNAGILLIRPLGTKFNEILIEIHTSSLTKMHLKMSSGEWRPFCLRLNVLITMMTLCVHLAEVHLILIKSHTTDILIFILAIINISNSIKCHTRRASDVWWYSITLFNSHNQCIGHEAL